MGTSSVGQRFQQAVWLAQQGKREAAASVFAGIVTQEPEYEAAWLWLAACLDDPARRRYCLERALQINPGNLRARRLLASLTPAA
ncbi:MAG TPA: hypothetical protein VIO36_12580, partial [Anaerolineaceae bacterium]